MLRWLLLPCITAFALFIVYAPSLPFPFYQDDYNLLELVSQGDLGDYISLSFTKPERLLPLNFGVVFRPIPHFIFFDIGYSLFNLNPLPFRLMSLLLLLISGVVAGIYALVITRRYEIGLLTSILLVSSRIFFEPVYWISANNEIFLTFFALVAVLFYLLARDRHSLLLDLVSIFALACALLSKETAVVIPALIGASVLLRAGAWRIVERLKALVPIWPHALLVLGFLILRLPYITYALDGGGDSYYDVTTAESFLSSYVWGFWWALESFVEPWRSILDSFTRTFSLFQPVYLGSATMVGVGMYAVFLAWRGLYAEARIIVLGLSWFFIAAFPPLYTGVLSSYLFALSAVGFCLAVATVVDTVIRQVFRQQAVQHRILVTLGALYILSGYAFVVSSAYETWPASKMSQSIQVLESLQEIQMATGASEICVSGIPEPLWFSGRIEPALRLFSNPATVIHELPAGADLQACPPGVLYVHYQNEGFEVQGR
ncbi:MAG: glycosyltransferase family 39 protein [Chloroflexaceae bacterium]|nr:glycosyltransferase family 39 protein [Chloroflexaceae bacterium]